MLQKSVTWFLACLFLTGSVFLPFSDFSLVQDIPAMYRAYEKIADPEEVGVADFIGDYLLGGKVLLRHNKTDKEDTKSNPVQFQHTPNNFDFVDIKSVSVEFISYSTILRQYPLAETLKIREFHPELFRPPLAV